jgi:hypothetical protein
MISADVVVTTHFYDLDPMQVVWHGNYPRLLEQARCALLDKIAFNYPEMSATGLAHRRHADQVRPSDPPLTTGESDRDDGRVRVPHQRRRYWRDLDEGTNDAGRGRYEDERNLL